MKKSRPCFSKLLVAYLAGELSAAAVAALDKRLRRDRELRGKLAQMLLNDQLLEEVGQKRRFLAPGDAG